MGKHTRLRVKPRRDPGGTPCAQEMVGMLTCWSLRKDWQGTGACKPLTDFFHACMMNASKKPKVRRPSINYHLQRMSKDL